MTNDAMTKEFPMSNLRNSGERSRPGCGSARPRAEHERTALHRIAGIIVRLMRAARARAAAPEAGAIPSQRPPVIGHSLGLGHCVIGHFKPSLPIL